MSRLERRLSDESHAYLGPVAIAQFLDAGWMQEWPLTLRRGGLLALRGGFGIWRGQEQRLPYPAEPSSRGAAYWEGRPG